MFDVVIYLAMFITGIVVGYLLDRLSNGRAGKSGGTGSDSDDSAAERYTRLEDTITRAEQANANAIQTIEAVQNLIHSVRDSNGHSGSRDISEGETR
jgi:Flp pilus assembly CpaF family ATPase